MRRIMIAAAMTLAAGGAQASSIDRVKTGDGAHKSIVQFGCPACTRAAEEAARNTVVLPASGQIVELREVGGQQMIYRTENWLGGTPVTMVSKATNSDIAKLGGEKARPASPVVAVSEPAKIFVPGKPVEASASTSLVIEEASAGDVPEIDVEATTAAIAGSAKASAAAFDASHMKLRLN